MKFFKTLGIALLVAPLLYAAHVPALRFISNATSPSLQEYPPITPHIETDNFEMVLIYPGKTYDFWFDTKDQQFVGFSMNTESEIEYVVTFDLRGNLLDVQPQAYDEYKRFEDSDRYTPIERQPNLEFGDSYSFSKLDNLINLAHFRFETFTFPYIFYFIPVFPFDWKGTAFIDIPVDDETLKFSIPTDFESSRAYLDAVVRGEIYAFHPDQPSTDIFFVQVSEHYSLAGPDGDIHRDGLGLYVVRRK